MKEIQEVLEPQDITPYLEFVPSWVEHQLKCLSDSMKKATVVHINSTASGGGVAEILHRLIPLQRGLGMDARWLVLHGDEEFFSITKRIHNALQGQAVSVSTSEWNHYLDINEKNAKDSLPILADADFVIVHDPQPAALLTLIPKVNGQWSWRCHIDLSGPQRSIWRRLRTLVETYKASVFSLARFARQLRHPQVLIPPAIDPLTMKNRYLPDDEVRSVCETLHVPTDLPLFVQVSRFDRFKDPKGVIEAFSILRRHREARLVLAGGGAADDPEGSEVLREVRQAATQDDHIHVLELPPDAHHEINALQRAATVIVQKSIREGFGLVVTEGLWKGKPVIGGAVGGITLQVIEGVTGHLVHTVEGCAYRMRQCLRHPTSSDRMGYNGRELVRSQYLITRQLRDHLMLLSLMKENAVSRIPGMAKI